MKALRLHKSTGLRLHDEAYPVPGEGESLLKVMAVGICGSDLHWLKESKIGDTKLDQPLILGHEIAAKLAEEDRLVAVDPAISCGKCESCLEGNPNLCPQVQFAGHGQQDGGLREYMSWRTDHLFDLPPAMGALEGAMLEPLGVAIHAVDLAMLRPRMEIGIFGCGPIGLLIIQLALLAQAKWVMATDRLLHRLDAARSLGADPVILVGKNGYLSNPPESVHKRGLDVVFETAGDGPAVESAIHAARPGGRVIIVGIPANDITRFNASTARRKGLCISICRRMKNTYPRAIELVKSKQVDVCSLVTHRFPLERAREAFEIAAKREGLKVLVEPSYQQ
jgi:L-iditol 2-dehydrogenase